MFNVYRFIKECCIENLLLQDNTIHMAFTALCIAKKTVLMNWKNKIILISTNIEIICGIILALKQASADTLDQSPGLL